MESIRMFEFLTAFIVGYSNLDWKPVAEKNTGRQ